MSTNATLQAMSHSFGWERFVNEYLVDYDSLRAVRRTFPEVPEGERKRVAARLLREPWVMSEIERRSATRITLANVTLGRITTEYARTAFFDPRKLVRKTFKKDPDTGDWKHVEEAIPLSELDDDTALALKEFKRNALGEYDVKAHDKLAALQALAVMTAHANGTATTDAKGRPLPNVGTAHMHDAMPEDEVLALLEGYEDDNQSTTIDGELDGGEHEP